MRIGALHGGRGLTELEEAWLVRSLYREDQLSLAALAARMHRHKSWVWRRLMLVEALDPLIQSDVRLGLLAPRAAVAVSRLPRGNQQMASTVVVRRDLTVRQTELLVDDVLAMPDPAAREALLARRLEGPEPHNPPGPRPSRAVRNEADWMSMDIVRVREIAARLEARPLATPLEVFTPTAAELMRDVLACPHRLSSSGIIPAGPHPRHRPRQLWHRPEVECSADQRAVFDLPQPATGRHVVPAVFTEVDLAHGLARPKHPRDP